MAPAVSASPWRPQPPSLVRQRAPSYSSATSRAKPASRSAPRRPRQEVHRRVDERRSRAPRFRQRRAASTSTSPTPSRWTRPRIPKAARSALYRNLGHGRFEDVTDRAGVGHPGWAMGVCTADVDGDGWEDIYVTGLGAERSLSQQPRRHLHRHRGDGRPRGRRLVGGLRLRRLRPGRPTWTSSSAAT